MKPDPAATGKPSRVFFALWPDARVAKRLDELGAEAHAECAGRRTRCETLHLTLAFIGDVSPQRLAELIAVGNDVEATSFTLRLDLLGGWRHNRIVWAGAQSCPAPLTGLVERLNGALEAAGFAVERRPFAPHVTLLRKAHAQVSTRCVDPIDWPVDSFVLVESVQSSAGAHYRTLREWRAR
ncbi:RNA 2',3'-cyclic phosphodiesterase [Azoarcus sp. PA01]|nr:RNA 2',3'-cyclic phosphodiesterase [Azoarcus sp. PA01]